VGQSAVTTDHQVFQGTATSGGGTYVVTLPTNAAPYTDQLIRIIGRAYLTEASGGHLLNSAALIAEYVIENKNNTTTAVTALGTSSNPANSNTAGFELTSRPEVADTAMNTSTAVWTLSSSQAVLTVTNNGTGSVNANVTVVVDIEMVGST
jgi:hypothetical protein